MNANEAIHETNLEAGGFVKGVAIALVTQNKDPDGLGRVKLRYPWHSQTAESDWTRIAAPMAGSGRGIVFLPEVGDEVLVAFEREDMRFPYVLGGLWNGKEKPPESNAAGKNDIRVVKTRKGHVLLFDDNSSKGRIELKLNDGKKLTIDDDGIALDDGSGNSLAIDTKGGAMAIKAVNTLTLKAETISVEGKVLTVKGTGNVTIKGSMVNINPPA